MKHSRHSRHRVEERFSSEMLKLIKKKLARGDCTDLEKHGVNNEKVSLVELPNNKAIIAVWVPGKILTVITTGQYLEKNKYLIKKEDIKAKFSKYCGVEREGNPSLRCTIRDLIRV
jgi:hypothetical protein